MQLVELLKLRQERTPDRSELIQQKNILVFVYGTLKEGGVNHGYLTEDSNLRYLGQAKTAINKFCMYNATHFPIVVDDASLVDATSILGEIYAVSPDTIMKMDMLEGVPMLYRRIRTHFTLVDQKYKAKGSILRSPVVPAYMYVMSDQKRKDNFRVSVAVSRTWDQVGGRSIQEYKILKKNIN